MNADRYEKFNDEELILRDQLAIDRTVLANDRTILSFIRTALAFFAAGGTALHFFEGFFWHTIGWFSIFSALIVVWYGMRRYKKIMHAIAVMRSRVIGLESDSAPEKAVAQDIAA